jgi:hypothetical protein
MALPGLLAFGACLALALPMAQQMHRQIRDISSISQAAPLPAPPVAQAAPNAVFAARPTPPTPAAAAASPPVAARAVEEAFTPPIADELVPMPAPRPEPAPAAMAPDQVALADRTAIPAQRVATPMPHLRPVPFFIDVASTRGRSAGGLRLTEFSKPTIMRIWGGPGSRAAGNAPYAAAQGQSCPYCNTHALGSQQERPFALSHTPDGDVVLMGKCGKDYVYEVRNQGSKSLDGSLQLGGQETWNIGNLPPRGTTFIKSQNYYGQDIAIGTSGQ